MEQNLTRDDSQDNEVNQSILSKFAIPVSPDGNMLQVPKQEVEMVNLTDGMPNTAATSEFVFTPPASKNSFGGQFSNSLSNFVNTARTNQILNIPVGGTIYTLTDGPRLQFPPIVPQPSGFQSSTLPIAPINLDDQNRLKLERKRLRNRIAASRCRTRKLELISKLQNRVNDLNEENFQLNHLVNHLKEDVLYLRDQVVRHIEAGCDIK